MSRRIHVEPHLTVEELRQRFRSGSTALESRHYQVLWMAAKGQSSREIVEATDYGRDWVFVLIRRYNAGGPEALSDGRECNRGRRGLLSASQQDALAEALKQSPSDGGLWSGPKVAAWMSEQLGRPVSPQRGWDYLRRLGYTPLRPRTHFSKADPARQAAFKKGASKKR